MSVMLGVSKGTQHTGPVPTLQGRFPYPFPASLSITIVLSVRMPKVLL